MKFTLKRTEIKDFKGIDELVIDYGKKTSIEGKNGSGKTTMETSFQWVMNNTDAEMKSNPAIFPLNREEATPTVIHTIEIDGKEITLCKKQNRKVSKPDANGVSKVALTNAYEINSVPKSERDFKLYLEELGVDFDLLPLLSHTDAFVTQKNTEMRKALFGLVRNISDKEIAQKCEGAEDIVAMLDNYTVEEIKAMQNSTMRSIRDNYGKDGEIIRAKIEATESSKVNIDKDELLKQKEALKERLAEIEKKGSYIYSLKERKKVLEAELREAEYHKYDVERAELNASKQESLSARYDYHNALSGIETLKTRLEGIQSNIERADLAVKELQDDYRKKKAEKFDSKKNNCKLCGQMLPKDKIVAMMKRFENERELALADITADGKKSAKVRDQYKAQYDELKKEINLKEIELVGLKKKWESFDTNKKEVAHGDEYFKAEAEVERIKKEIEELVIPDQTDDLRAEREIDAELDNIERHLALLDNNARLDGKIAELREMQSNYEQKKADCEMILYELDLLSRKKNEMLTDEINKHFNLVTWKLFDYQKNGEYKEVCVAQYNGKDMSVATNTGLELMMKLDIINGLQKFYKQYYPVFIDGAECLSSDTFNSIKMNCQTVWLKVAEGDFTVNKL